MKKHYFIPLIVASIAFFCSCKKEKAFTEEGAMVFTANGNLNNKLNEFRSQLGSQLNVTTGEVAGRREINWDALHDSLLGKPLPLNLFNPVEAQAPEGLKRGLTYAATGGDFRISSTNFADINPGAASQFNSFSGARNFASINSNAWEVMFQVAGTLHPASVKGFGAIFSDVDLNNSTYLEFFNGSRSLGKFQVPAHDGNSSFSFLGVYFSNSEVITRIQVNHNGHLSSGLADISMNGTTDLVVLDDFLYSEPIAR